MSIGIVVKNYEHYNRAMEKHISSKKQYDDEMKRGGFVSFEEGEKIASKRNKKIPYDSISPKAQAIISSIKQQSKKNFKLSDRAIDAIKELGVRFERQDKPTGRGGFDAT